MEKNYQRRIEKIAQAIYLVSNHLKDNEPLKWELRKESIGFLSCIRTMDEDENGTELPPDIIVEALTTYARDLLSLLSLAVISGLISRNNGQIITQEIQALILTFQEMVSNTALRPGFVLSHDFFATDSELDRQLGGAFDKGQGNFLSDKSRQLFNEKIPFPQSSKTNKDSKRATGELLATNKGENDDSLKDRKDSRQARILTLLRAKSNLSIKDFAAVIPDCSEKTIQRELLVLVEKGVVKKDGERRWSTYSLKETV